MITIETEENEHGGVVNAWYVVVGWDDGTPISSARRGALTLRCAACLGDVKRPIIAATPEILGEIAWHGGRCARCHARVSDPRLVLLTGRVQ